MPKAQWQSQCVPSATRASRAHPKKTHQCACRLPVGISLCLRVSLHLHLCLSLTHTHKYRSTRTLLCNSLTILITGLSLRTLDRGPVIFYSFPNCFFYRDVYNLRTKSMSHCEVDKHTHGDNDLFSYVQVLLSHAYNLVVCG